MTPNDGFAKVHYGFILKAQNKIAESIPYLKVPAVVSFWLLTAWTHLSPPPLVKASN